MPLERASAERFFPMSSRMRTAMHQVSKVATNAIPTPTETGLWYFLWVPFRLAVRAARTRIHSKPFTKYEYSDVQHR